MNLLKKLMPLILADLLTRQIAIQRPKTLKIKQQDKIPNNCIRKLEPNNSNLVKEQIMKQTKIKDIESKYFTISDYDKFKNNIPDAKITEKRLVNESDFFRIYKKL